jgi:uncharacterized RmlC-like cupin family protein
MQANVSSSTMSNVNDSENKLHYQDICIIRSEELDSSAAQTPGSKRLAVISLKSISNSQICGGLLFMDPKSETAIHHHGAQETIVYVLQGEALIRWGERGEFESVAKPDIRMILPCGVPPLSPSRLLVSWAY